MYCSTCGARVPDGHTRCTNCGAPVSRPAGFGVPAVVQHQQGVPLTVAVCPRCGFQGPTVSYFSQGSHVAGLIVLTLFTLFPAMGFGGLLYYWLRRDHRCCARCGQTIGKGEVLALAAASQHGAALPAAAAAEADMPEGGGGVAWSVGSVVFFVLSAILMLAGFGDGEPAAVFFGLMAGGAGGFLLKRARAAREERRQSLLVALQQPVLRLAGDRGGRLTVTEVASTLGWPMRRAEKVLNSLDDGLRVVSDITNEGVIVYDFRELRHTQQQRLSADEVDTLLSAGPLDSHLSPLPSQPVPQAQPVAPTQHPGDGTLRA
jgi:hypothetical protein